MERAIAASVAFERRMVGRVFLRLIVDYNTISEEKSEKSLPHDMI